MENNSAASKLWKKLQASLWGRWLFIKIVCHKAPYFKTIHPRIVVLQKNCCEAHITQTRSIENHIGSVHAIALCNLAELSAGLMTDVSVPGDMRWIPQEMTVKYLKKATGKISAKATPAAGFYSAEIGYPMLVNVVLSDSNSDEVFAAQVSMWISKKSKK